MDKSARRTGLILLLVFSFAISLRAQSTNPVQYYYDGAGRLTTVVDPKGNVATYQHDAVGNLLGIVKTSLPSANALAIFNFTPQSGPVGQTVTIQGQSFSTTPSNDAVQFNGTATAVLAASTNTLTVTVPAGAATGPISVTVAGTTATSTNSFTVTSTPVISSINPATAVQGSTVNNFQVTGLNLTAALFSFLPTVVPTAATATNVTVSPDGTSATMTLTLAANFTGPTIVAATNAGGSSSPVPTAANTLTVVSTNPNLDSDGDGLTDVYEVAISSNPENSSTTNDGIPDGWAAYYGLNPNDPSAANTTAPDGLTYLQAFQQNVDPLIPLTPPAVSQIFPADSATNYPTNGIIVARFDEPLQVGANAATVENALLKLLPSGSNLPR
jgi:YD repeat-containing protein